MKKNCYINGIGAVAAQDMTPKVDPERFGQITTSITKAVDPNYKEFIPLSQIRRMSKAVKMGVTASSLALKDSGVSVPNAIITGTGLGCVNDSEKFLKIVIDNDEEFLTPTSFIQSTHNTVGAQIALGLGCKAYNVSYVHGSTSFETALIDTKLQVNDQVSDILVGGVDEIGTYTSKLFDLAGHVKREIVEGGDVHKDLTSGACLSEGALFFVASDKMNENTYANLLDVSIFEDVLLEHLEEKVFAFLQDNHTKPEDIDLVLLGNNGDKEFDHYYHHLQQGLFKDQPQAGYKNFSGEFHTASAFGFYLACIALKENTVSKNLKLNNTGATKIERVLLYNQYRGKHHSLVLLESC